MKTADSLLRLAQDTNAMLQRHPRRLTAAVVTLLLGSAVTAFGVAPLAPDAADLPRRVVTESVTLLSLDAQLQALETHAVELYRSDLTRNSDTADTLLQRLGVDDPEAAAFLRRDSVARKLLEGRAGKMVRALTSEGRLAELVARSPAETSAQFSTHFTRLTITRDALGLQARTEQAALATEVKLGSGTIESSLFAAADDSRLPDPVTMQIAELFGNDIDFRRELRRGDSFTVLYEALTADGEPITWNQASGRVLAAQFINGGRQHDAVWFQDAAPGGKMRGAYFGLDGRSKTRMFLASPMAFSRVTSGFAMRLHPIMKTWRAHLGVDYGAPTGTAVRAVGDGAVEFSGWQNGYGNVVILRHPGDRETRYAHLSRIDVKRGQRVEQSQTIGAVGATGWATGPHLHYEFRVRGQVVDPMTIARNSESFTISPAARSRFDEIAGSARSQLAVAPATAAARFE
ncbi:M23 family metallopeptidase [uncultured Methylibium sp.]|uniref:M23 family metallopeptidase n=1 Tax=uncultured Methylibium sp. TaxID=381093 RepID=UPI0025D0F5B0|nr:M23 family metallopeptidase [uncultured Methylibium sp.]